MSHSRPVSKSSKESTSNALVKGVTIALGIAPVMHFVDRFIFALRDNPKLSYQQCKKVALDKPFDGLAFGMVGTIAKKGSVFFLKQLWENMTDDVYWSGFVAGAGNGYLTNIVAVGKWQRFKGNSAKECFTANYRNRGIHSTAGRNAIFYQGYFGTREMLVNQYGSFLAGLFGAVIGSIMSNPVDVIVSDQRTYGSTFYEAAKKTYSISGTLGFFRALPVSTARMGVAGALTSVGMELWDKKMKPSL